MSRLHCPRAQDDTTEHLWGALVAILSLHSLITTMCAFESTYSCVHCGHACSMLTSQAELMQETNGKENCHGSCVWSSSNITLLDCLQKWTKSTPTDFFTQPQRDHFTRHVRPSKIDASAKDAFYEAGLIKCSVKAAARIFFCTFFAQENSLLVILRHQHHTTPAPFRKPPQWTN